MLKTVQTVDEINYVSWCEVEVNGDTLLVKRPVDIWACGGGGGETILFWLKRLLSSYC